MKNLNTFENFRLDAEFEFIIESLTIALMNESNSKEKLDLDTEIPYEKEWTFSNIDNPKADKLKAFIEKLPVEKALSYFKKALKFIKSKLNTKKRQLILSIFIAIIPLNMILLDDDIPNEVKVEVKALKMEKETTESINNGSSFDEAQEIVKLKEGGYTDDKDDDGNWSLSKYNVKNKINKTVFKYKKNKLIGTNHGISAHQLEQHLGREVTKKEMMELDYNVALEIYSKKFWYNQNLDKIKNQNIANIIYDACVNQGINGTKTIIRKSLKEFDIDVKNSETYSIEVINKINDIDSEELFDVIKKQRLKKYKSASKWWKYKNGWQNRLNSIKFRK